MPSEWIRIVSSRDLRAREHVARTLFGQPVVVFRGESGQVHLIDGHCPHLGAHLATGGRVEGDAMVCPFHGWRVGGSGEVLDVPYSDRKPPRVCVQSWPLREQDGQIYVHHPRAEAPGDRRLDLPPYPTGWYTLCFAWELGDRPVDGRWFGRPLRLVRSDDGAPRVIPLDGGPEVPVVEQQDAVIAWLDTSGRAPWFRLPLPDPTGWSSYNGHCWDRLRSHPQETSENSVDVAHFEKVHRYRDVETLSEAEVDGPVLTASYGFTRHALPYGFTTAPIRVRFTARLVGLGYSLVESRVDQYGLSTRQLVMCTPVDEDHVQLRIMSAVRVDGLPGVVRKIGYPFARWGLMRAYVQDVSGDLDIWENKRYLDRPRIVSGDGPIGRYRRWVRQFYPGMPHRRVSSNRDSA